jgi:hypothetical protein
VYDAGVSQEGTADFKAEIYHTQVQEEDLSTS